MQFEIIANAASGTGRLVSYKTIYHKVFYFNFYDFSENVIS
jgi:hypothetical protein